MAKPAVQLDLMAGIAARDDALATVAAHAPPSWNDLAYTIGKSVAEAHPYFTSDDLWAAGLPKPPEARALGPVLNKLRKDGVIEPGGFRQTSQVSRHAAPVRIWRSVVYVPRTTGGVDGRGGSGEGDTMSACANAGDAPQS